MVRTQIQLTESQATSLKRMAARQHVSMAELIRRAIDCIAVTGDAADSEERRKAALAAAGKFHSGQRDLSKKHDRYLAEAFGQ